MLLLKIFLAWIVMGILQETRRTGTIKKWIVKISMKPIKAMMEITGTVLKLTMIAGLWQLLYRDLNMVGRLPLATDGREA